MSLCHENQNIFGVKERIFESRRGIETKWVQFSPDISSPVEGETGAPGSGPRGRRREWAEAPGRRLPTAVSWRHEPAIRSTAICPPPPPLALLAARCCDTDSGPRSSRSQRWNAGGGHHRSRQHIWRLPVSSCGAEGGNSTGHRVRGLRGAGGPSRPIAGSRSAETIRSPRSAGRERPRLQQTSCGW